MRSDQVQPPASGSFWYNPKFRGLLYQGLLLVVIILFFAALISNVIDNLARNRITSGFGFLESIAGFDISQTLIDYSISSATFGRAFWVGLLNTILVASIGIVLTTILGFLIGIARLSSNWLVAKVAGAYVEMVRNIPLLLHLLFFYNAVLKALPDFTDSLHFPGGGLLNSRGLFLAKPVLDDGATAVAGAVLLAVIMILAVRFFAIRRQERTGMATPTLAISLAILLGLPTVTALASGFHMHWTYPELGRFNVSGGLEILPEFAALLFGLVIYTAAFIAEVVRAGLMSVPRGQTEAAAALGLRRGQALKLVIIPQAKRVIIPPLTNQYLNLIKNSSLAVAIGYPDFVQIFTGTVLNLTGQAVEVVAITLAVYLAISLVISLVMNWYQSRMALVQR
jgi:general L-amino acid transport system permease protein